MTIYMDETGSTNSKHVGYGTLFVHNPDQCKMIVENALQELSSDDNLDDRSKETIKRGYFHACEDSSRAREALFNEIIKLEHAEFVAYFMDVNQNQAEYEPYKKRKNYIKDLMNDSAFNASFCCLERVREPVHVVIENRIGLSKEFFEKFYTERYHDLLMCCYGQAWIPLCFPKLEFSLGDKSIHGLQICDFLLWAIGRKLQSKESWLDKIKGIKCEVFPQGSRWNKHQIFFQGATEATSDHYYGISDYDKDFEKHMDEQSVWKLFCEIQEVVIAFSHKDALPPHAAHLNKEIKKIRYKMGIDARITLIAELYLKLFDTIPLIDKDTAADEKPRLLYAKRMMGQLLLPRNENAHIRLRDFLLTMTANKRPSVY